MDVSSPAWLSEFGMEDLALDYLLDDLNFDQAILNNQILSDTENINSQITSQNNSASPVSTETTESSTDQRPKKQRKTNNWGSFGEDLNNRNPSRIISFGNSNSRLGSPEQCKLEMEPDWSLEYHWQASNKKADKSSRRTPIHALDHVLAEKKRREKINKSFIALSAAIPGLKKTDKASILGEALKYLKQQEERIQKLKEQATKQSMESAVILKKSRVYVSEDDSSSTDEDSNSCCHLTLPDIDARVSNKEVLIRIHCENYKGCVLNILNEVEKLGLSVINSQVLPFGSSTLSITIVAQMEAEYSMTVKDLLRNLSQSLLRT